MQQITIVLTTSKGVVIRKTLTKPEGKPIQLSLPPGTKISVEVKGPSAASLAPSTLRDHKLVQKKSGADLVIEGEGEALVRVSDFYNTKDVALGNLSWDYAEPQPMATQARPASTEATASPSATSQAKASAMPESPTAAADGAATVASVKPTASSSMGTGLLVLGAALGLGGGGGGGGGGSAANTAASTVVSGTITAGPVVKGKDMLVEFFKADGTKITSTSVDDTGHYKADLGNYSGVVIIRVTGAGAQADFMDEATQTKMHLDATLLAVGSVVAGTTALNVNALTTIAAQKAGLSAVGTPSSSMNSAVVTSANMAVAKALGLSGEVTQWEALPFVNSLGQRLTPDMVGAVLAAISGQVAKGGTQQSAMDDLVGHFGSDGTLSATGLAKLLDGALAADKTGVLVQLISKGVCASGYSIDPFNATTNNQLQPGSLKAGDVLSGKVVVGTSVTDLSMQFLIPGVTSNSSTGVTKGTGSFTLDTLTSTWRYILSQADVIALQGGLTGNKDGAELIQLKQSGIVKATYGVFYSNGIDDAPEFVNVINGVKSLAENASDIKLGDIVVVDPDGYSGMPTLSGTDAADFKVVRNSSGKYELWLATSANLNYDMAKNPAVQVNAGGTLSAPFTLTVTDVNYAPLAVKAANLPSIDEDSLPIGADVASLFADSYSNGTHDTHDTLKGIAICANAATSAQGVWQWSSDDSTWVSLASSGLNDAKALYLNATAKLRFLPAHDYNGTPGALTVRLVDSTGPDLADGSVLNATHNGASTAISSACVQLNTDITSVNDPPAVTHALIDQFIVGDGNSHSFQLPLDSFADDMDSVLTYSATLADGSALPSWLTFDAQTRTFTAASFPPLGEITIRITAKDSQLASAVDDFTLTVQSGDAPLFAPTAQLVTDSGNSSTDHLTSVGTIQVSGVVLGATWSYSTDAGAHWTQGTGNSLTLTQDGTYNLLFKQTYGSQTSVVDASKSYTVTLDTTAPASIISGFDKSGNTSDGVTKASLTDVVGTGMTHSGWHWQDNHCALLEGTSEAFATVVFTLGGESKTVTADSTGYWNYRMTADDFANVGVGDESITVISATDRAGNVSTTQVTHQVHFNAIADTVSNRESGYGSPYIDALIFGKAGWNGLTLTYSFAPGAGLAAWTDSEKAAFLHAFQAYENICNVHFVEGKYSSDGYAATSMVFNKVPESEFDPPEGGGTVLGDFWIPHNGLNEEGNLIVFGALEGRFNYEFSSWNNLTPGGMGFDTIIHELGHGLGLEHPFDGSPTFPGVSWNDWKDLGDNNLNQGIWTMMAYTHGWQNSPGDNSWGYNWGYSKTPMTFDVAALQTLYGANLSYKTGNDLYVLPTQETIGTGWECIWDAGGVDTLTNDGASSACQINLNAYPKAGGLTSEPYVSYNSGSAIAGGFTIAEGVTIENATGGSGDDRLIGNQVDNVLTGGAGNDTLTGGEGADWFVFNAALNPSSNVDILTDFSVSAGDLLELSVAVFSKLAGETSLATSQFKSGAGLMVATDVDDYILYNTSTGDLYYDSDGSGASAAVLFAVLQNRPIGLSASQFVVI